MRTLALAAAVAALVLASCSQQAHPQGAGFGGGPPPDRMGPQVGTEFTPGWMMMDPAERAEHRRAMLAARTPEECRQLRDEHLQRMQQRARERGMGTMPMPMRDACAGMPR